MSIEVKLEGGNILTHMRHIADADDERFKYFHYHSKLWRAIQDTLRHNDNGLIEHPKIL